jgi:hypothetical protein
MLPSLGESTLTFQESHLTPKLHVIAGTTSVSNTGMTSVSSQGCLQGSASLRHNALLLPWQIRADFQPSIILC